MDNGLLITFEGIDGCGKSTLLKTLASRWANRTQVLETKEPGGSLLGKQLRTILQEQTTPLDTKAEFLLFAADRAQHFNTVVIPALKKGFVVFSDRCADSSIAYQGYGGNLPINIVTTVNHWAMQERSPDIVIYLRINPTLAAERLYKRNEKLTAFEQRSPDFWHNVVIGFETLYKDKKNIVIIDATQSPEQVLFAAEEGITKILKNTQWESLLITKE